MPCFLTDIMSNSRRTCCRRCDQRRSPWCEEKVTGRKDECDWPLAHVRVSYAEPHLILTALPPVFLLSTSLCPRCHSSEFDRVECEYKDKPLQRNGVCFFFGPLAASGIRVPWTFHTGPPSLIYIELPLNRYIRNAV